MWIQRVVEETVMEKTPIWNVDGSSREIVLKGADWTCGIP